MNDPSYHQQRFWNELILLKTHTYYVQVYQHKSECNDNYVNIFLALTSSGSIAGWAIWNQFQLIWGAIIAASQLVNVIKTYLPYQQRSKKLIPLNHELDELMIDMEEKWYGIATGEQTSREIHNAVIDLKKRKAKATKRHIGALTLPTKGKILNKAEALCRDYFFQSYSVGG